jgi:hypothetical protein
VRKARGRKSYTRIPLNAADSELKTSTILPLYFSLKILLMKRFRDRRLRAVGMLNRDTEINFSQCCSVDADGGDLHIQKC